MKKGLLIVFLLFFVGGGAAIFYFFYAGEIKNTLQFDDSRFVNIQGFLKQGKLESLQQAKLQLSLLSSDYKKDSVIILKNQLNETAMTQAKLSLKKGWYGSAEKFLSLISNDYKKEEVDRLRYKLSTATLEENINKTKVYIKERNVDKAKVYYAKIDTSYSKKKRDLLLSKIDDLDNELKIEKVEKLMAEKEFDDARDLLAEVDQDFDTKKIASLSDQINEKEKIASLLDDEGAIIAVVEEVKKNMNDPESFEHVETTVYEKGRNLQASMRYREINTYGAKELKEIQVKLSKDGNIKKISNK
ncbi:hypothetical protein KMW28_13340 [Flammeovirga yaeyamensis]|uniref:Uncharacterized protein n=1 Tax=Flammeovirga yaeyamensis TaxID=367791 RepID=A0AAX1N3A2_9BACT|nr:hypothetical protein [Flammeovirga yaeyamensis]MBB3700876.1 hypothetical protein [Flammeovirga yaeyamensis]NMF37984.1 hypothetical protein [Flammeovirga yaeyamensis]QWG00635.1 hypothetical protein KMW28_13340 [Flammeovirga yaeyamensis]